MTNLQTLSNAGEREKLKRSVSIYFYRLKMLQQESLNQSSQNKLEIMFIALISDKGKPKVQDANTKITENRNRNANIPPVTMLT